MELCGLPKARPIVWSDCPAFQRHHRSVICAAESLTRFPWAIDTTSEKKIYIRWCCTDLLRPPLLAGMWITIGYSDKTSKRRGKSTSLCCPVSGSDASACRRIGHSATPVKTHRFRTTCDLTVPQQNPNEPSSTHERPTRPISKAKASGWETGSTFCSRGPARYSARLPQEDDSLSTKGESSGRKQVTALRRASTLLRTFPW